MREGDSESSTLRTYLLAEGFQVVELVVGHFTSVQMCAGIQLLASNARRAACSIILRSSHSTQILICKLGNLTVGAIFIGIAILRVFSVTNALGTLKLVIAVLHRILIAIVHALYCTIRVVGGGGQHLIADFHNSGTPQRIVLEVVSNITRSVSRGVVLYLSELILGIGVLVGIFLAVHSSSGFSYLAVLVVGVADGLTTRIGDRSEGILAGVYDTGNRLAACIRLSSYVVAIRIISRRSLHETGAVAGFGSQAVAIGVIGIFANGSQRAGRLAQQMLFLLCIGRAPFHGGLYRGRTTGLVIG